MNIKIIKTIEDVNLLADQVKHKGTIHLDKLAGKWAKNLKNRGYSVFKTWDNKWVVHS